MSELKVTTKHIDTLPGSKDFKKTAKDRLYISMYNKAYQKLGAKFSFQEDMQRRLADIAARTFLIHAEGNEGSQEHAQAVEQIYADISGFTSGGNMLMDMAMKILKPILESILTDTSNYGDPERADCTDDLTLTIPMIP